MAISTLKIVRRFNILKRKIEKHNTRLSGVYGLDEFKDEMKDIIEAKNKVEKAIDELKNKL